MKKRVLSILMCAAMLVSMAGCGSSSSSTDESAAVTEAATESTAADAEAEVPETSHVVWAQGLSGNILVTIALQKGYFEELGLDVEEVPLDDGQLQGVTTGQVDIASNSGTNGPLQTIAAGDDMAIIGGFMLNGCMPIIAKEGTEWNGITDFVGKKVASNATVYANGSKLLEAGYDPVNDVEWVTVDNDADKIGAVLNGEVDYAVMGTGRMYMSENTEGIEILAYCDDITYNYSCCRMVARKSWVEENPTTVKLLNEALLRAQSYFEANREECVKIMAEQLDADEEYVAAYMEKEDHYVINVDTVKKTVLDNWEYYKEVGIIDADIDDSIIEDAIYNELYKEALDGAIEKYYDEDPDFYDKQLALYEELE